MIMIESGIVVTQYLNINCKSYFVDKIENTRKYLKKLFKYLSETSINNLTVSCDVRYDFGETFTAAGFVYKDYIQPTCYYIKDKKYYDRLL